MKINIRPVLLVATGLLLLFLFIPIYPIGVGNGATKSILNILIGVKYKALGETGTVNRAAAIATILFTIGSFIMSLADGYDIQNNKPFYIFIQLLTMACWIGDYYVAFQHYVISAAVAYRQVRFDEKYKDAMLWPKVTIFICILVIALYALLYWESKIDIRNLSLSEIAASGKSMISENNTNVWYCKNCFSSNDANNIFCGRCGTKRSDEDITTLNSNGTKQHTWICGCGTENLDEDAFCTGCGSPHETVYKPEFPAVPNDSGKTVSDISEQNTTENSTDKTIKETLSDKQTEVQSDVEKPVFCRKCGTKSTGGGFCRKCGTKLI